MDKMTKKTLVIARANKQLTHADAIKFVSEKLKDRGWKIVFIDTRQAHLESFRVPDIICIDTNNFDIKGIEVETSANSLINKFSSNRQSDDTYDDIIHILVNNECFNWIAQKRPTRISIDVIKNYISEKNTMFKQKTEKTMVLGQKTSEMISSELSVAPMHRICKKAGAHRVSHSAAKTLTKVLDEIGVRIAREALNRAIQAGKRTIKADDIENGARKVIENSYSRVSR